ncbi:hypothetical protein ACW5WK_17865 [Aeromonas enteropelogenes]|uniref:hypothetical protein n=1 Tax=Aeromonas enteropelogenes TaxID=29489 RepID=UPI000AFA68BE|nr:hypothetical protein [Aeromonas enteropelogenes]UBH55728.1 hypothetical protein LA341_17895 [Aeromonas enteropelogenes]
MSHATPHTGKKQQTGGWNSGAVALPAPAMANVTLLFYTVVMVAQKEEVKRIRSTSEE